MAKIVSSQEDRSFEVYIEADSLSEAVKEAAKLADDAKVQGYGALDIGWSLKGDRTYRARWFGSDPNNKSKDLDEEDQA